jgi:hypothetical protein
LFEFNSFPFSFSGHTRSSTENLKKIKSYDKENFKQQKYIGALWFFQFKYFYAKHMTEVGMMAQMCERKN